MLDTFTYLIYVSLLFCVVFLTYLGAAKTKLSSVSNLIFQPYRLNVMHISALLLLCFVVGFRYEVGYDWVGYRDWFTYYANNPWIGYSDQPMELGFYVINRVVTNIGGSYTLMFFIVALISWFFYFKSVSIKLLPIFLFFLFADEYFFWSMNVIRQFLALGVFLFSIRFIINREPIKYFSCVVLAIMFHSSAVIVAPFYFIPFEKLFYPKTWFVGFLLSLFLSNSSTLITQVEGFLRGMADIIPLLSGYVSYFENDKVNALNFDLGLGYLFRLLIACFVFYFSSDVVKRFPSTEVFFILFFAGTILYNLFYTLPLFGRFNQYFLIMRPVVLAVIVYYLWHYRKNKFIPIILCVLYFFLYLMLIYNSSNSTVPYQFDFARSI